MTHHPLTFLTLDVLNQWLLLQHALMKWLRISLCEDMRKYSRTNKSWNVYRKCNLCFAWNCGRKWIHVQIIIINLHLKTFPLMVLVLREYKRRRGKWCAPPLHYLNYVQREETSSREEMSLLQWCKVAASLLHVSSCNNTRPNQLRTGRPLQVMNTIALVQYSVATQLWELTAASLQKAEAQQLMADPFWSTWERNWVGRFGKFKIKSRWIAWENRVSGIR